MISIHRNGTPNSTEFIEYVNNVRSLKKGKLPGVKVNARYAGWITVLLNWIVNRLEGFVDSERRMDILKLLSRPRRHRSVFWFSPCWVGGIPGKPSFVRAPFVGISGTPQARQVGDVNSGLSPEGFSRLPCCASLTVPCGRSNEHCEQSARETAKTLAHGNHPRLQRYTCSRLNPSAWCRICSHRLGRAMPLMTPFKTLSCTPVVPID